jgi:glycosyltransferase involved in cell wall biosynthesis
MNILIDSFNCVKQNESGGIQVRINYFIKNLKKHENVKLFDKWSDKIIDYDILHIFKVNSENLGMVKLAKRYGIPIITSAIIPSENRVKIIFSRMLSKFTPIKTGFSILRQILLMSDAVVAQTQKEADFIAKYYKVPKERLHVIPNGINININEAFKDEFVKRTGITGKYVLQVGRFDENKNQLNVIKAMANSNIPVVFIGGEDSGKPEYYEKCKSVAPHNIHFLGWIKHDDPLLSSAYQNAHVVVLPSYKEIFGNSLIEGGAAGANLVATAALPIDDWGIKDICRTINPNDINDIRSKIMAAYNESLKPLTSKIIKDKFSWDSVIRQHIEVYQSVLKTR